MENAEKLLDEPSVLTPLEVSNLKVPDLRRELKLRGLTTAGNKSDLVERLQNALAKGFESMESADEVNEDEVLGDVHLLSGDDAKVQEISEDEILGAGNGKDLDDSLGLLDSKPKPEPVVKTAKTSLVRTHPIVTSKTVAAKPDPNPASVGASKENKSGVIEIRTMTSDERLALRAQKFNQPLNSESRLKIRSERFGLPAKTTPITVKGKAPITKSPTDVEKLKQRAERFGQVISTGLKQVEDKEKLLKRKQRFGTLTTSTAVSSIKSSSSDDEKKRIRAERFASA